MKINYKTFIHSGFMFFSLMYILPLILILSASFTNEETLSKGYSLIPRDFDLSAYQFIFKEPQQLLDSYVVTAFQAFLGTFFSSVIMALCAYPLSRQNFKLRKHIMYFIAFTMLFNGGLIPSYIINTRYLNLRDSIWVYIIPGLVSAWYIIIFRTFFQNLPHSLVESAKIDGASELRIFFTIILPLSKPVLATLSLFGLLDRWNNWYTAMIYISNTRLYSLQYLLQKILMDGEFLRKMAEMSLSGDIETALRKVPSESMKFAMCILAAGPMMAIFPFFQKYFAKGLTIGAVKG